MKLKIMLLSLAIVNVGYSEQGHGTGNGGDTACEGRLLEIRNDMRGWFERDGHLDLKLPKNITFEDFKLEMLKSMEATITCNSELILINGAEKTCKNYADGLGKHWIQCNFNRFNEEKDEYQYRDGFHEHAGTAGFEVNKGEPESDY